jgi:nitrous oxidase accessory protein
MRSLIPAILCLVMASGNALASPSLADRIAQAKPGDSLIVDGGTHRGPLAVDKPLTLVGINGATLDAGGSGDVLILAAPDCQLRGFTLRGSGDNLDLENTGVRIIGARVTIEDCRFEDVLFGIDVKSSPNCVIRRNHISSKPLDIARRGDALRLFRSDDCLIEDNVIENGRDALLWYSNRVVIRRNISRNNRYGLHMMYANDVTVEDNLLSDNSVGIYLMYGKKFRLVDNRLIRNRGPSGYGLGLKEVDQYTIEGNVFAGNRVGAYIDGSPYTRKAGSATFARNAFTCNDIGLSILPAVRGNRIFHNSFVDNIEQVAVQGRGAIAGNDFAVEGRGNFWSDYGGYDANHDGVGDQPYASRRLFENLIDREPKLRLLLFSPAHDAIEFVGRAMPSVRPEPKFTDTAPLMAPPPVGIVAGGAGSTALAMAALAGSLLAFAGLVLAVAGGKP